MSVVVLLGLVALSDPGAPRHHVGSLVAERAADIPAGLETVDGDLILGSSTEALVFPELTDVTGRLALTLGQAGWARFPRLERVHGGLEIELRGTGRAELPRLEHVGGPLGLDLDPEGPGIRLPRLRRHEGGLWLFGGGDLSGLLPRLRTVAGTVFVQPSGNLEGLFPSLERVSGHLVVNNGGHRRAVGLDRLTRVDGGVYVFGGDRIHLPGLRRVGGALAIRDTRAEDLGQVGRARVGALLLSDNPELRTWPAHLEVPPDRIRVDGSPRLTRPRASETAEREWPDPGRRTLRLARP